MNKCTQLLPFVRDLFDDPGHARKAIRIIDGINKARSAALERDCPSDGWK